jgi:hypothetical protein
MDLFHFLYTSEFPELVINKLIVAVMEKNFPAFVEPGISLPCSK